MTHPADSFLYLTCRGSNASLLKNEVTRRFPDFRFSYSRRGFQTWIPGDLSPEEWRQPNPEILHALEKLVFARSVVRALGKVAVPTDALPPTSGRQVMIDRLADSIQAEAASRADSGFPLVFRRLHVWEPDGCGFSPKSERGASPTGVAAPDKEMGRRGRSGEKNNPVKKTIWIQNDGKLPAENEKEPQVTPEALALHREIFRRFSDLFGPLSTSGQGSTPLFQPACDAADPFAPASLGDCCLDVIVVAPNEWWVGYHFANDFHSCYPGGLVPLTLPWDAASRAWLKFEEGIRWSRFPLEIGSRCADIGAAPGGGSQALLARGAVVLGVDPAEIAPQVIQNPNFTHLRGRVGQIKRKNFRKTRWVIADMNVAPSYTLDVLEELVGASDVSIRGLLFTLKLFEPTLAEEIPDFIRRVKSWGFNKIRVRQLVFNHQEVMVAAIKKPFHSR